MAKQNYISKEEAAAIRSSAEHVATTYVKHRLERENESDTIVLSWTIMNGLCFLLRKASGAGTGVWLSATSPTAVGHNCVSSKQSANKSTGVLTISRFDATEFIDWIEEEMTEAIIRYKIIKRIKASSRGKLKDLIVKAQTRASKDDPIQYAPGVTFGAQGATIPAKYMQPY